MSSERPQISEVGIEQMFDKIAFRYDFLNAFLSAGRDKAWRKALSKRIPQDAEGSILDVATGTADILIEVAKTHPKLQTYKGIDISQKMLDLADTKFKQQHPEIKDISFQKMSAQSLDFADDTFDYTTISFGLRNVVDPEKALQEFYRCLKPNGSLLILEFLAPNRKNASKRNRLSQTFLVYVNKILPKVASLFSDKDAYSYLPQSVAGFYDYSELVEVAEKIGFKVVYNKPYIFGYCQLVDFKKV